jgi:hypothetical protein
LSLYQSTIPQFSKMLRALDAWLTKAEENATARKFDPAVLLGSRLTPDQFSLTQQIQAACDAAKSAAARLTGTEQPKHPDTETTLVELRARIATVLTYLATFKPEDFEGAETRDVSLPFMPGKLIAGSDYLNEMALPNFYFHLTTAYAILRHNGIPLGKPDFIAGLNVRDA